MRDHRVVKIMVLLALAIAVIGSGGAAVGQDKAPPVSSEPAVQGPPPPKTSAPRLPDGATSASAVLSVAGTAFHPRNSQTTYAYYSFGYMYAVAASGFFNAPIYLPQGAVVTSIRMNYYDADTTNNCVGVLTAYGVNGAGTNDLTFVSSSGSSGYGYADSPTISHTIDYSNYSYVLNWIPNILGSNMQLGGFTIFYTPPPGKAAVIPLN